MVSSLNFDLKERLDNNVMDSTTLNPLCKNIASGICYTYIRIKLLSLLKYFFKYIRACFKHVKCINVIFKEINHMRL